MALPAAKVGQPVDASKVSNYYTQGNTFKAVLFAIAQNEVQVRFNNLEDRFDDEPLTYVFDALKYAR